MSIGRDETQIWTYLTDYIKSKYSIHISKDILSKIHLNGVMISLNTLLGLKMNQIREINFDKFVPFDWSNIEYFRPLVKDYCPVAFSLKICQDLARDLDESGKAWIWYLTGT